MLTFPANVSICLANTPTDLRKSLVLFLISLEFLEPTCLEGRS
jgi:hypothetical protein